MGFNNRIAFVIPTKDRPELVRRLLENVRAQSVHPELVVVVDAGNGSLRSVLDDFPDLGIRYIRTGAPGLTRQKNLGFRELDSQMDLIAFIDDDMVFEPGALEAMLTFWERVAPDVGGASFNIVNAQPVRLRLVRFLRRLFLMENGEYGVILRSGFNTPIVNAPATRFSQWLNGGCTVWCREVFREHRFDEWFTANGLCEDVRFSLQVGRRFRLAVVADARVRHEEVRTLRGDYRQGIAQVVNRLYVVRRSDGLSVTLCAWALLGQFLLNLAFGLVTMDRGLLARASGNCVGLSRILLGCVNLGGDVVK